MSIKEMYFLEGAENLGFGDEYLSLLANGFGANDAYKEIERQAYGLV